MKPAINAQLRFFRLIKTVGKTIIKQQKTLKCTKIHLTNKMLELITFITKHVITCADWEHRLTLFKHNK